MSTNIILTIIALVCLTCTSGLICKIGQKACGNQCYYTIVHDCVEEYVCNIGQKVCGGECYYDVGLHQCLEGHLCKLGQKICNGQCYYPITQKCLKRQFLI